MTLKEYLHMTYMHDGQQPPVCIDTINRDYLPELLAKFGRTKGAEIGVAKGKYAEIMFNKIPNLELLCVDMWEVGEDTANQMKGKAFVEHTYEVAKRRLAQFSKAAIIKEKSMDVVRNIPYESLNFVYIDACHEFDFVMQDIIEWSKRVKKGGWLPDTITSGVGISG